MEIKFIAFFESADDTPMVAPAAVPRIRIRQLSDNAVVVDNVAMAEVGDGNYSYTFTGAEADMEYVARADGDPNAAGQVLAGTRYKSAVGSLLLADLHAAQYNSRRWDKITRTLTVYTDNTRGTVRNEFNVNADLSDIAPA